MFMKTMSVLAALALCTLAVWPQTTNTATQYRALGEGGREIARRLLAFDGNGDFRELSGAMGALDRVSITNRQMKSEELSANLEILSRSVAGIDPTWDVKTAIRPRTKVAPRLPGGELGLAGADPASISDPVARKNYEEDIAENQKALDAFERQLALRRIAHSCIFKATIRLRALVNARDNEALDQAIKGIKDKVRDQKTQEQLLGAITNALKGAETQRAN
jgi:hypothetical protein